MRFMENISHLYIHILDLFQWMTFQYLTFNYLTDNLLFSFQEPGWSHFAPLCKVKSPINKSQAKPNYDIFVSLCVCVYFCVHLQDKTFDVFWTRIMKGICFSLSHLCVMWRINVAKNGKQRHKTKVTSTTNNFIFVINASLNFIRIEMCFWEFGSKELKKLLELVVFSHHLVYSFGSAVN